MIARRGLLKVLGGLIAAPAIVKVADLMPVKPSLVPTGLQVGDTLRIRLPDGLVPYEPLRAPELSLGEYSRCVLEPSARVLAEAVERNVMLSINEITREAVRLFSEENLFLEYINSDDHRVDDAPWRDPVLDQRFTPVQAAVLGAAAVLGRNPVVSRRFFGGVREEGLVASPGSSSSDPSRRNTNQETVA